MDKKRIFILLGHPDNGSYCGALARAYEKRAAEARHETRFMSLEKMDFEPNLRRGYKDVQKLEQPLIAFQENMKWAEHFVLVFPLWWASAPAKLIGLFDRAILPGFGFKFHEGRMFQEKLLSGRSARIIMTMDAPRPYYWFLFLGIPGLKAVKKGILKFCGVSPVRASVFTGMKEAKEKKLAKQIKVVEEMGRKGK